MDSGTKSQKVGKTAKCYCGGYLSCRTGAVLPAGRKIDGFYAPHVMDGVVIKGPGGDLDWHCGVCVDTWTQVDAAAKKPDQYFAQILWSCCERGTLTKVNLNANVKTRATGDRVNSTGLDNIRLKPGLLCAMPARGTMKGFVKFARIMVEGFEDAEEIVAKRRRVASSDPAPAPAPAPLPIFSMRAAAAAAAATLPRNCLCGGEPLKLTQEQFEMMCQNDTF